jgi:arabinose-5-phosphate isomerase
MNHHPRAIAPVDLAAKALAILQERKITSLFAVDAEQRVEGVVYLHNVGGESI